jgi:hypothetical protein
VYVIKRPDTQVVDVLFSTSATAPTMPANYTLKRLVGAVKTNGSSQFIQFIGYENGRQYWTTLGNDFNTATLTTARSTFSLTQVPPIKVLAEFSLLAANASATLVYIVGDTNLTDSAPTSGGPIADISTPASSVAIVLKKEYLVLAGNLYARASNASTTLNGLVNWFNVRPFN